MTLDDGFWGLATIVIAGSALAIYLPARILLFFVALKSRPLRRALITTSIPYFLSAVFVMTWREVAEFWYLVPFMMIPGALIGFWLIYSNLKSRWIEDPDSLPEGVELATDDWKEGMATLALVTLGLIAVAGVRLLWRMATN